MFKKPLNFREHSATRRFVDLFDPSPLRNHPDFRCQVQLQAYLPPNKSEEVRSWLGGQPEMSADQSWPVGPSGKMVFVAQICCADLPLELWGGVGPRQGWLLLFMDAREPLAENGVAIRHSTDRGSPQHEGSDTEVGFRYHQEPRTTGATPLLTRIPVRFVPSALPPKAVVPETEDSKPPIGVATYDEALCVVDALTERIGYRRSYPQNIRNHIARMEVGQIGPDRLARIAANSEVLWEERAHNLRVIPLFRKLHRDLRASPGSDRLPDDLWRRVLALAEIPMAKTVSRCVVHSRNAIIRSHAHPFMQLWRPVRTVGEWNIQALKIRTMLRRGEDFLDRRSRLYPRGLEKQAEARGGCDARDRRVYSEYLREEVWARRILRGTKHLNAAMRAMNGAVVGKADDALIDQKLMTDVIAASRTAIFFRRHQETIEPAVASLDAIELVFSPVMSHAITEAGIADTPETLGLLREIDKLRLARFDGNADVADAAGDLAATEFSSAARSTEHLMGGLPTRGWQSIDHPVKLFAYGTRTHRKTWSQTHRHLPLDPDAARQVVLFQFTADEMVGWSWGGMDYTAFIEMPHADLSKGVYDRVRLTVIQE